MSDVMGGYAGVICFPVRTGALTLFLSPTHPKQLIPRIPIAAVVILEFLLLNLEFNHAASLFVRFLRSTVLSSCFSCRSCSIW